VERVRDADPDVLRRAARLGLRPGVRVRVVARNAEDGTLTVAIVADGGLRAEQVLERAFALDVFVVAAT
jgi:hypothetical protein